MLQPVHAAMRRAVHAPGEDTSDLYRWLRYQLGWADTDGAPAQARTGKGVRPLLCLTSCMAVSGDPAAAVDAAAAIELTHEFSLVHDDIEDRDRLRRGRPALWTLVGEAKAINCGDALFALARRQITSSQLPPDTLLDVLRRYDLACVKLAEGQHLDLSFETAERVTVGQYVAMVRRKTGALLAGAAGMGAACGGADGPTSDALSAYGEAIGVAFQMQDDVLGLWGAEAATGKPTGSDLARGKKSLPIVLALGDADLSPALSSYLTGRPGGDVEAADLAARMEAAGYRDKCHALAAEWSTAALRQLDQLDLEPEPGELLTDLANRVVARDH